VTRIKKLIKHQCKRCIVVGRKFPTNKLCCNAMKRVDMACVCRSITPKEQITISIVKVVDVAKDVEVST
jgi:hypothetical protein